MMTKPKLQDIIKSRKRVGPDDPLYASSGLVHQVYIPKHATSAQPVPLVVMLHGWGGDEYVMWIFKHILSPDVAIFTPRAPIALSGGGFVWFDDAKLQPDLTAFNTALTTLDHFLSSLVHIYPIDPTRLILIGFSQGAYICNALTLLYPNKVLGVASLAGAMPTMPQFEPHARLLAGLPVFIAHGLRDETIPLKAAHHTRDIYHELGADVTYGEYAAAHKMHSQAMKDLKAWLAKFFNH